MNTNFLVERLESRRLLAASTITVQVDDLLFIAESSGEPTGGSDLYRSDLDGSNRVLLKHWLTGTEGPNSLFGFHGQLYFAATQTDHWSRQELWKSDGTSEGTARIGDSYLQYGSYPHDFMIVNDHLLYEAQDYDHHDQIFTTDGNSSTQLINPPYERWGDGGYYNGSLTNLIILHDRLYAEISNWSSSLRQIERWETDGTVEGTGIAEPFGLIQESMLRVFGTTGNDVIKLNSRNGVSTLTINGVSQRFKNSAFSGIFINGLQGNDSIDLGNDVTLPASINGNVGDDSIVGGGGDDLIDGGAGSNWIDAGRGNDQISAGYGITGDRNMLLGGLGNDSILGTSAEDWIRGGDGDDSIEGNGGYDLLEGAEGQDTILGSGRCTIRGGDGNDSITGFGEDLLEGGDGQDTIFGGYLDDTIQGGAGDDVIFDAWGNDSLAGNGGDDSIVGGLGEDTLDGGPGRDTLDGGEGDDVIHGGSGDDSLIGGDGDDQIIGGPGRDTLVTGLGNDRIELDRGDSVIDMLTIQASTAPSRRSPARPLAVPA